MWATWTDISEFIQKRNLMCVPTVERDSTRPPPCRTTKKSTPRTSLASVLNAQRSSKLAEFCWSIYELFTSTQLRVLPRLVLPCKHENLSNWKSPGNQQQCAVLVQEICKPGGSQNWRKSVDQMLLLRSEISWNCIMILCILCHIIQHPTFRFVAINFRTSISYGTTWQRHMVDRRPFLAGEWILAKSWLCENQIAIFTFRNILNLIFYDFLCPSFNWLFKHAGLVISISTRVNSWKYTSASRVSPRIITKRVEKLSEKQKREVEMRKL